jgi:hypothetical protein
MSKYTDVQKRAEIGRELALRRRLYPYWVAAGKMTQEAADKHIAIMEAIWKDYAPEEDKRQKKLPLEID